jgi:hypothetical protein
VGRRDVRIIHHRKRLYPLCRQIMDPAFVVAILHESGAAACRTGGACSERLREHNISVFVFLESLDIPVRQIEEIHEAAIFLRRF